MAVTQEKLWVATFLLPGGKFPLSEFPELGKDVYNIVKSWVADEGTYWCVSLTAPTGDAAWQKALNTERLFASQTLRDVSEITVL